MRTNSVKESFELRKKEFLSRLIERGYPKDLVQKVFNPANQNVKKILMKHWHLISGNNNLVQIYPDPPIVACLKVFKVFCC